MKSDSVTPETESGPVITLKYRQRFAHMADWIEKSETSKNKKTKNYFSFSTWLDMTKKHSSLAQVLNHPCGMVGCIGGWASMFQAALDGYEKIDLSESEANCSVCVTRTNNPKHVLDLDTEGQRLTRTYFGITNTNKHPMIFDYLVYGQFSRHGTACATRLVIAKLRRIAESGIIFEPAWDEVFIKAPERWADAEEARIIAQSIAARTKIPRSKRN